MVTLTKMRDFREEMRKEQTAVYSYRYEYNKVKCFVAICLLTEDDKKKAKAKYALIRLRFMKRDNLDDFIDCYANSKRFMDGAGEIRRFFNISFNDEGFEQWLAVFYKNFDEHYPTVLKVQDPELKKVSLRTVYEHEGRDPNRIYRLRLLRHMPDKNGNTNHRTEYNSQLAKERFPKLWEIYKNDRTVSFAFTDDPLAERSEEEIYARFIDIDSSRTK